MGNLDQALDPLSNHGLKPDNPTLMNLVTSTKETSDLNQALTSTLKSLELKPDNPTLMNLGGITKTWATLRGFASTIKSLELKPDNPDL